MMRAIKAEIQKRFPGLVGALRAWKFRRYCRRTFGGLQDEVEDVLFPDGNIRVLHGPFAGTRYYNRTVWGPVTSKWLGSYEEELHEVVGTWCRQGNFDTVVDVGCAEGYYAVGMARALPDVQVFAYDADPWARKLTRELGDLNGLGNLHIGGFCGHGRLQEHLQQGRALLICDIEGGEYALLDPEKVPALAGTEILVEVHIHEGMSVRQGEAILRERFYASHDVRVYEVSGRSIEEWREKSGIDDSDLLRRAMDEWRCVDQVWLHLKPSRA